MTRFSAILLGVFAVVPAAQAQDAAVKKTIAFVQKLQVDGGGFRAQAPRSDDDKAVPTLRSTSAAIRALKYLGGDLPDKDGCTKFVASCWNADAGGFSDVPSGKPEVFTTAVGLMAVVELKMPTDRYAEPAVKFFRDHVKSFEEVRIAAAGFESVKQPAPKVDAWHKAMAALRNDDGTYGKGLGMARDTAGATVTRLRLGGMADGNERVLKVLNAGQRQNGGWGKADQEIASDLETTYRVMRCYVMLKAKPANIEGVRSFAAKCRNADGGYAVAPGEPSSVGGTYFAAIILHWLKD
jgi:hypothetical protein